MSIREELERREHQILSPYASFSDRTRGRKQEEAPCDIRPAYERDRDRILHSKSFRRLKHKTQVFLAPEGDYYRTRLTHTLEVAQIARTIARALRLNEDLTEAIALGHDLGHTPFGHAGEDMLNRVCPSGFAHYIQSVRIVEVVEKNGRGLNLTEEVRDGILNHRTSGTPHTLEGKIVRISDKIAYINHDIDDAVRAGILTEDSLPKACTDVLGHSVRERLDKMVRGMILGSLDKPDIVMEPEILEAMMELRAFMFEHVYLNPVSKGEEEKAKQVVADLFGYYRDHFEELPEEHRLMYDCGCGNQEQIVCDYIAGMSDLYAIGMFQELFLPKTWKN
ncbi:MAG: deoxyguanosinetriphosphate triphosphohydrolase [Lachnospiraceae bacterium]|nr:deoxyguanosinetriphosphate triphosphohydrolase [Lachnospiraceae bacterium]